MDGVELVDHFGRGDLAEDALEGDAGKDSCRQQADPEAFVHEAAFRYDHGDLRVAGGKDEVYDVETRVGTAAEVDVAAAVAVAAVPSRPFSVTWRTEV